MTISKNFTDIIKASFDAQLKVYESMSFTYERTRKTPKAVINLSDFYYGEFIASLKSKLQEYYKIKHLKDFTEEELTMFDELFIEYQDKFAKYFY